MEATAAERYASGGPGRDLYAQNLALAFQATVDRIGDDPAIRAGHGDDEPVITWNELRDQVGRIAGGLASLGVSKGDTVAIMLNNRPEFIPIDMAAVSLGAVPFSIYQTSSPEQIEYVVSDAGAKVAIVEPAFLEVFEKARANLPQIETLIVVDGEGGDHTLAELEAIDPDFDISESVAAVEPDDLLTLIYTSGTTGPPKGVQLTHRNLMTLTAAVEDIVDFPDRGAKVISWLPAAHIAERGAHYYLPVIRGCTVTICPNPRDIVAFLPKVRPTWFFAVPRIWEKLKAGLEANLSNLPGEQGEQAAGGARRRAREVASRAGGGGGPRRARGDGRGGRREDVLEPAHDARPRRGRRGQRRRGADPARGARVLPRDRDPDRRALGDVGDLRDGDRQPARRRSSSARSGRRSRGSRSSSPRTARSCVKGD